MFSLFTCFMLLNVVTTWALRSDVRPRARRFIQTSDASPQQCQALIESVDRLLESFSCLRDHCQSSGSNDADIPKPPNYNPSGDPPQPSGNVVSTTTTTTTRGTTGGTTAPDNEEPVPPSPTPCVGCSSDDLQRDTQSGVYIASWYAYKKHYMGLPKLGVFHEPRSPELSMAEYVFFPYNLHQLAPKITHLYYAFASVNKDCIVEFDDPDAAWYGAISGAEPTWIPVPQGACKGIANDMMALKSEYSHMKLMLSVGGWTFSRYISKCATSEESRAKIINSAFFWLSEMDPQFGKSDALWNGVDIDWEFPEASNGLYPDHTDNDWENFYLLAQEFKQKAASQGRNQLWVTAAIGMGETLKRLTAKPETTKKVCSALDSLNLMEYDLHGKWDKTTGHNANFCLDPRKGDPSLRLSVSTTVHSLLQAGCPSKKLSLGIPNYSPAWTKIPPGIHKNGLFTTATDENYVGWSTFSDKDNELIAQGILSYWDIKANVIPNSEFEVFSYDCPEDHGVVVPIKHIYNAQKQIFSCYEDTETVRAKIKWAKAIGLGGFFFWDSQQDKHGELLTEAFSTWGLTPHEATGTRRCYQDRKPDFSKDPSTGQKIVQTCTITDKSIKIKSGQSCSVAKTLAEAACGSKNAVCTGGSREWNAKSCVKVCSSTWGATSDPLYVGDTLYYECRD